MRHRRVPSRLRPKVLVVAWALAASLLGALPRSDARAASGGTVVLVKPTVADAMAVEVLSRVRGELLAAGFEVLTEDAKPGQLARDAVETAGAAERPVGAFGLVLTRDPAGNVTVAELWVSDRLAARTVVERTVLDSSSAGKRASALAVRAAELLRVSLAPYAAAHAAAAVATTSKPVPAPAPTVVAADAVAKPSAPAPPALPSFSAGVALGWLGGALENHAAWQGSARLAWRPAQSPSPGSAWETELVVHVPATRARASDIGGDAKVTLLEAGLGLGRLFRTEHRLRPFALVRLGLLRIAVEGTASPSFRAESPTAWAGTSTAGAGLAWHLGARLVWRSALEIEMAWPRTDVRIGSEGSSVVAPGVRLLSGCEVRF